MNKILEKMYCGTTNPHSSGKNFFETDTAKKNRGTDVRFAYSGEFSMAINPGFRYENNSDSYAMANYF